MAFKDRKCEAGGKKQRRISESHSWLQGKIEIEREEKRTRFGPNVVNVNNVLVPEETTLADGDWVSLSPDLLDI